MKYIFQLFISIILFALTQNISAQTDKDREGLIQVDLDFSNLSAEKGMNFAFLSFADNDAVVLKPNSYPIRGIEKLRIRYSKPDTAFNLTWKPMYADVAASLELGYTYGTWEYKTKDENGNPVSYFGTYITIWKKNKEGKWKFVLDTGSNGLEEKE
jgi:ketosteroid isomerase-like protein